jgi:hypothetical protein
LFVPKPVDAPYDAVAPFVPAERPSPAAADGRVIVISKFVGELLYGGVFELPGDDRDRTKRHDGEDQQDGRDYQRFGPV